MRNKIVLYFFFFFSTFSIMGQKKSDYNVKFSDNQASKENYYNAFQIIESRPNPDDLGVVYVNSWHGVQFVTLAEPIPNQLDSLLITLSPPQEELRPMALQLRMLRFGIGEDGDNKNKGLCNIRMSLYGLEKGADDIEHYYYLATMDTLVVSDMKKIRENASDAIESFIRSNLNNRYPNSVASMSLEQVYAIDNFEKTKTPFYQTKLFVDGIYNSYAALKILKPDDVVTHLVYDKDSNSVLLSEGGKTKKLKDEKIYAVIIDGVTYIRYNKNFYRAYFKNNNLQFTISQKAQGGGFMLGLGLGGGSSNVSMGGGVGIPIGGKKEKVEMVVDHLNGDFYWGDVVK